MFTKTTPFVFLHNTRKNTEIEQKFQQMYRRECKVYRTDMLAEVYVQLIDPGYARNKRGCFMNKL